MSSLEDKRLTPLVSVGRITLVNPTSNQGWLGWLPLGYQVFRSKHPPHSESTALWIRTADDCYVGAAPEYIV